MLEGHLHPPEIKDTVSILYLQQTDEMEHIALLLMEYVLVDCHILALFEWSLAPFLGLLLININRISHTLFLLKQKMLGQFQITDALNNNILSI